ncbi:hypothetical protein D3C75_513330 [compost metagenome]
MCIRLTPVDTRLNGALRYATIETDAQVHLLRLQSGGQIVIDHKVDAVFIRCGDGWPGAGIIQIGVEILCPVGHVVGHQVDVIQQRCNRLHVDPRFWAFRVGTHGDSDQFILAERLAQFFQQRGEVIPILRLAGDQAPCAIHRVLPVEIDAVQAVFFDNFLCRTNKYRPGPGGRRCAREATRAPAANGEQHLQIWVLFTQGGD